MKHMFDFKAASLEMNQQINIIKDIEEGRTELVEISPKVLQLKWTDIEVRKYRMNELQEQDWSSDENENSSDDEKKGNEESPAVKDERESELNKALSSTHDINSQTAEDMKAWN